MSGCVFFISDLHIAHRAICTYRPQFSSMLEHDEFIVSNWNKVVRKKNNIVWVLGDVIIKNNKYPYDLKDFLTRLNGTIKIIPGNHCHLDYYPREMIQNPLVSKYKDYWLSHAPVHPHELRGKKNIHGHVHYKSIFTEDCDLEKDEGLKKGYTLDNRYINVCCENINFTPISLEEIRI